MISIGILTYNAPDTLLKTLETYSDSDLLSLSDDIYCVIQYSDKQSEEIEICKKYNIRFYEQTDNGKMAWGFKKIYEYAKYDIILFLENDFIIKSDKISVKYHIKNAEYMLNNNLGNIIRCRSRIFPGVPNYSYEFLKDKDPELIKNNSHLSSCIWWLRNPELIYPEKIKLLEFDNQIKDSEINNSEYYIISSQNCNYTNNPYICKKDFFKKEILPHIEFGKDLEKEIQPIWEKSDYKCIIGFGIFTHERYLQ